MKIIKKISITKQTYEKHEIHRIQRQNHGNQKKIFIPLQTNENHEIIRF